LYCEPPKILDENNECVTEISSEKWREVFQNSSKSLDFIYLDKLDKRRYGKIFSKSREILPKEYDLSYLAAIGRTAEGKYEMLKLKTCYEKIQEQNEADSLNEGGDLDLFSMLKILVPQVLSIIFFLLLVVLYLTIGELRKTVHGQCWINFLINSFINYSAAITQLIYMKMQRNYNLFYLYDTEVFKNFTFTVSSTIIIYTEFSLYFWLNITFFEAFYMMR
jgi:hypothetical protein